MRKYFRLITLISIILTLILSAMLIFATLRLPQELTWGFYGGYEFLRVFLVYFDIKAVKAGEYLEQQGFAFHDRLSGHGSDISQSKYSRTIGYHSHKIAFVGVFVGIFRIVLDLQARPCHSRRVCQGEVVL